MLAAWANLHWNGPASAAASDVAAPDGDAAIKGFARGGGADGGIGQGVFIKPTRLRSRPAFGFGSGVGVQALPKARVRLGVVGRIGELSQDDVTGAVLEAPVEGDLSLKAAIRLLLAYAAGNATGLEGATVAFRSLDGGKVRIAGTVSGGARTITTRDAD